MTEQTQVASTEQKTGSISPTGTFKLDLGHKVVTVRKWKAKDRKNFRALLKDEKTMDDAIIEALVKNCILDIDLADGSKTPVGTPKFALTYDEIQWIFTELRALSIGKMFKFKWKCTCEHLNEADVAISEANKGLWKEWETVTVGGHTFTFQDIPNATFYYQNKTDEEANEMAFFTKNIDGDETRNFEQTEEFYDDMDIDEFDEVLEAFKEMNFHVDNTKKFKCEKCDKEVEFEFDEIPGFFPDTWTE